MSDCNGINSIKYAFQKDFPHNHSLEKIFDTLKKVSKIIVFENCDKFFGRDPKNVDSFFQMLKELYSNSEYLKIIMVTTKLYDSVDQAINNH